MNILNIIQLMIIAFITSYITVYIISKLRIKKILAKDFHKPYEIYIPKIGGLCLTISSIVILLVMHFLNMLSQEILILYLIPITLSIIGLVDDIVNLHQFLRIFLTCVFAILFIFLIHIPSLKFPILGSLGNVLLINTIVIALLIIYPNALNMIDVLNGITPSIALISLVTLMICKVITSPNYELLGIGFVTLAQILPLLIFNKYPAKVFNGNVGTYFLGSLITIYAILSNLCFEYVLCTLPLVINGLLILITAKGFRRREEIHRPTKVINGIIYPELTKTSPITLVKLIVFDKPDTESNVVKKIITLFMITALITMTFEYLTQVIL